MRGQVAGPFHLSAAEGKARGNSRTSLRICQNFSIVLPDTFADEGKVEEREKKAMNIYHVLSSIGGKEGRKELGWVVGQSLDVLLDWRSKSESRWEKRASSDMLFRQR